MNYDDIFADFAKTQQPHLYKTHPYFDKYPNYLQ